MCFYFVLFLIGYGILDTICTKVFLALAGPLGATLLASLSTFGFVLLLTIALLYGLGYRLRSAGFFLFTGVICIIPGFLTKLLLATLLFPSGRRKLRELSFKTLFSRKPNFQQPPPNPYENNSAEEEFTRPPREDASSRQDPIDIDVTVHKE